MKEADLHRGIADLLNLALVTPGSWWSTLPLGGGGKARGGQLKRIGTKVGMPDILINHAGRAYYIELKTDIGRLSTDQIKCHEDLRAAGCAVAVARSPVDVLVLLMGWGVPVRGRIAA